MDDFDPRDTFGDVRDDFHHDGIEPNLLNGYKEFDPDSLASDKHPTMIEICRSQNEAKLAFKPPTGQTEKLYLDATARKAKQQMTEKESQGDKETDFSFQPELSMKTKQIMANRSDHLSRTAQWHEQANARKEEKKAQLAQKAEEDLLSVTRPIEPVAKVLAVSRVRQAIDAMAQQAQAKVHRVAPKDPNYTTEVSGDDEGRAVRDLLREENQRKREVLGFLASVSPDVHRIPGGRPFNPDLERAKVTPARLAKQ